MSSTSSVGILETFSSAVENVAETVSPSVVSVSSDGRNGTGVVWDDQGHVVTAYHVVQGLDEVEVGSNGGETFTAKVIGRDSTSDIALLKVEAKLSPIAKGDSDSLRVGQFVMAMANPYATKASATSGMITSVKRSIGGWWGAGIEDAVVTDARLNPGYSGGPLVDASGRMVALNIAYMSSRGIAVPIKKVSATVEKLASGKAVGRAYLGIVSHPIPIPEEVAKATGIDQESGLIVLSVEDGSAAKAGGLSFGDVVLGLDGNPTAGFHDLRRFLTDEKVGKPLKVKVLRGGRVEELSVTPGSAPESE
ncbi:MAG: trypsin-like peptidase domain-containing protein [Nitrososphaerales archaeon]|jgi:S1-C subfamily serine protease